MFETANKIRQEDLNKLANDLIFEQFANETILITGATGLIGSEIVFACLCANRIKGLNIKVVALVRNEMKAKMIFNNVLDNPNFELLVHDVQNAFNFSRKIDYVIHLASYTSSIDFVKKPVETILTSIIGTKSLLDFSIKNSVKGFLYLSSLEVYGLMNSKAPVSENEIGCIDSLSCRSSYSLSKKMAENLCIAYGSEFNLNVKIARLCQTFGAGITKDDNRLFAQLVKSAVLKNDIILHTEGKTVRNYCYITDAVSAILTILKYGLINEAYNVANNKTAISVKKMAEYVAKENNLLLKFEIDDKERGYNPTINICLDTTKLNNLGWSAKVDLAEMFKRTILFMNEENIKNE